jgi:hypothetical protein
VDTKKIIIALAVVCVLAFIVIFSVKHQTPVVSHAPISHTETVASADNSASSGFVVLAIGSVLGLLVYFVPAFVAKGRNRADAIFMLNLLLGWTLLGWIGALIWAMCEKPKAVVLPA